MIILAACRAEAADWRDVIIRSASALGLDPRLALAIARYESGLREDVVGCTLPLYKAAAVAGIFRDATVRPRGDGSARVVFRVAGAPEELDDLLDQGDNCDYGLFQVNSFWLRRLGLTPSRLMDPETNIAVGLLVLQHSLRLFPGDPARGVEAYGTGPKTARARDELRYFDKIVRLYWR